MSVAGERAVREPAGLAPGAAVPEANLLFARALLEGLVAGGVRHFCLAPGSRSSPLALAAHADSRLALHVQVDERSCGFLALGLAKATLAPVALLCTSGTAAANFLPAVVEAALAGVPLVVLTADRPPELRNAGAPQTIDQLHLYGSHARAFRDLPCPDEAGVTAELAAQWAAEACSTARSRPAGPVHLNIPFREPLVPEPAAMAACDARWVQLAPGARAAAEGERHEPRVATPGAAKTSELAARFAQASRPLILAGPEAASPGEAGAVLALAKALGAPVFADIASGLRFAAAGEGDLPCAHADLFLRDEAIAALAPDLVLRFGGIPTSKVLAQWLARHRPPLVAVQPDERRRDPDAIVGEVVVAPTGDFCAALAASARRVAGASDDWRRLLAAAERGARLLAREAPHEAAAVAAACGALPAGGALVLASSMPIRWAEMYASRAERDVRVFANRGANGIDGTISTAAGVAIGTAAPTLLVTGDLAFLHDLGGLRSAREATQGLAILLLNNDGGGIFSHLPIARHEGAFEPLFGTPQGCDLEAATRAFGIEHRLAASVGEVAALAREALAARRVRVIEWRTDRAETAREQASLARRAGVHSERVHAAGVDWEVRSRGVPADVPLVLLHGFTGTGEFWRAVVERLPARQCFFPDLPGHGGSAAPTPPEAWRGEAFCTALAAVLDALGIARCALAGYSMGGRLALAFAVLHPERVAALALAGASPGLAFAREREERASADLALAQSIERDGIEAFVRRWEAQPLFASQGDLASESREAMHRQRLAQDPARLAAALRAFGTAFQPDLHPVLARVTMPTLVAAGERDAKFVAIARFMAERIPRAEALVVPGCGHAVPLERPEAFAAALEGFLQRSIDR